MQITIVGPNLPRIYSDKGTFHVHKAGCRDIAKLLPYDPQPMDLEAQRKLDAVDFIYGPDAGSFYEDGGGDEQYGSLEKFLTNCLAEFHFAPCVKELR